MASTGNNHGYGLRCLTISVLEYQLSILCVLKMEQRSRNKISEIPKIGKKSSINGHQDTNQTSNINIENTRISSQVESHSMYTRYKKLETTSLINTITITQK